jgi:hypothetical protein
MCIHVCIHILVLVLFLFTNACMHIHTKIKNTRDDGPVDLPPFVKTKNQTQIRLCTYLHKFILYLKIGLIAKSSDFKH